MASPLQLWLETLRSLAVCPAVDAVVIPTSASLFAPSTVRSGVWLEFDLPSDGTPSTTTQWIEALELLVLLAWADQSAWMDAAAALRLTKHNTWKIRDDVRVLCDYFNAPETDAHTLSPEYYAVRAKLEAVIGGSDTVEIPVRLRQHQKEYRHMKPFKLLSRPLTALAKLRPIPGENASTSRTARIRSRVRRVHDDHHLLSRIMQQHLQDMVRIWLRGIRAVDFPRVDIDPKPSDYGFYVHTLHDLLGVQRAGCVERVVVGLLLEPTVTPTLLSALAHSSSVCEVYFDFEGTGTASDPLCERRHALQWLAYALFSPRAEITITKVTLRCDLLQWHEVDVMREVLEAEDPLVVLYPDLVSSVQAHHHFRVSARRIVLENPTKSPREAVKERDIVFNDMRVLDFSSSWWCVLLPGWGPAWVAENRATVSRVFDAASQVVPTQAKIRQIDLKLSQHPQGPTEDIMALLRLVGAGVKTLHLGSFYEGVEIPYGDLLISCSALEGLVLEHEVVDQLAVWADYFAQGRCKRLKHLYVRVERMTNAFMQQLEQVFGVLLDKQHPMTRQLESFGVRGTFMDDGWEATDLNPLSSALRMLEGNTTLTRLTLYWPVARTLTSGIQHLSTKFAAHHNVMLPTRVASLGHREKAAFLSVISNAFETTSESCAPMRNFDCRIISLIFEFAPDRRHRLISVPMPTRAGLWEL